MIIEPRIRDNVCLNAHPLGCAAQVNEQIAYVRSHGFLDSPKRVLVVGASNGYGLAARIVSAFASGAATLGVSYERPGRGKRTASAGWYNNEAFKQQADIEGLESWDINGDAFSQEIKQEVLEGIKANLGQIDLLVYSLASPRRTDPQTGELYTSVIKPIGAPYTSKSIDFLTGDVFEMTMQPATDREVEHTVKVMGGEDWSLWIQNLLEAGALADGFTTYSLSYIGPECTRPIYRDGTIGHAKIHLEQTADDLKTMLEPIGGQAWISVNKALVTRASAVIPAVPLYISLLYRVMKAKGLHEDCIRQMDRLYRDFLYNPSGESVSTDEKGRIRLDDWEMRSDVQQEITQLWDIISSENVEQLADVEGFRKEFLQYHGFDMPGVDYTQDVAVDVC